MSKSFFYSSLARVGTLMAIALLFVFSATDSQAQCLPDCTTSTWSAPTTSTISLAAGCSGCSVQVTYVTRLACSVWQDMQITEIQILSTGCTCSSQEIFEATFEGLLTQNPPIFTNPGLGQCADTWRISAASCFNEVSVYLPGIGIVNFLIPCDVEGCCLTPLRVCRDGFGEVSSIDVLGGPFGSGNCSTASPISGGSSCFTTCEFDGLGKGSAPRGHVIPGNSNSDIHALALPNPALGSTVEIDVKADVAGSAQLAVYDLQGRILKQTQVQFSNGAARVTLDVSDLQQGTYMYELTAAGRKLISNKLVIAR